MTRIEMFAIVGALGTLVFPALGVGLSGRYWAWANAWAQSGEPQLMCGPSAFNRAQIRLPFNPGDRLVIALPGSVRYRPGDKGEAIVVGDAAVLDHVRLEDGKLRLACEPGGFSPKLEIDLTGPAITEWELTSSADLELRDISQPELRVNIRGSGNVTAGGTVHAIGLKIYGSGNFKGRTLAAKSAEVEIRGSGNAQVAAEAIAGVSIDGSGNVKLFGNAKLSRSKVTGSGRISQVP